MRFLGVLLLLGGYTFIYAAVARGGVFATEPWMGLVSDAYEPDSGTALSDIGTAVSSAVSNTAGKVGSGLSNVGKSVS